jgi:alginate O-acetyltransferase complex protein AlgI
MSFVSFSYLFLLIFALGVRAFLRDRRDVDTYPRFLLVASLIFYASYVPRYVFLLLAVTLLDFYLGLGIAKTESRKLKRILLSVSILSNVGILAFYKYAAFIVDNLRIVSSAIELPIFQYTHLNLILPLGISFFVFQSMSYNWDVYRGVLKPERRYWRFLLFVSFFTHLISGPIVRGKELIYQFGRRRRFHTVVAFEGIYYLILGFFLKKVVADNLALYVNNYWRNDYISSCSSGSAFLLALYFSCQIFSDFAGYTSIAWGSAYLLGFRLPANFNHPYLAASFREFWMRWHITLSRWMRDYLYIPLGGNRVSSLRVYLNLWVVMLVAGLWHGAAWTFIAWGGLHGSALVVERALGWERSQGRAAWVGLPCFLIVQAVVLIGWILFRSKDFGQAGLMVERLLSGSHGLAPADELIRGIAFVVPIFLMHAWGFLREHGWVLAWSPVHRAVLCAIMLFCIWSLSGGDSEFIYFHF